MSNDETGGPAFPSPGIGTRDDETQHQRDGMTLWDWYAGHAVSSFGPAYTHEEVARYSADIADAMIAERKKRGLA